VHLARGDVSGGAFMTNIIGCVIVVATAATLVVHAP